MEEWKRVLISKDSTILDAIKIMDTSGLKIGFVMVIDDNGILDGVVTDGDVRRGLVKGVDVGSTVEQIMSSCPIVATENESENDIVDTMKFYKINHIPIVNSQGVVIGLKVSNVCVSMEKRDNPVIIMVGGRGRRLRPLTYDCPKPMLKLGERPLLDMVLRNLIKFGFYNFYLAVNYKKEMIKDYFGNGEYLLVNINYIEEGTELGTAGALSLYGYHAQPSDLPILVINGDILTDINYPSLLRFYEKNYSSMVVGIKEYSYHLPYGVVEIEGNNRVISLNEKPKYTFYVNAGIYVLDPKLLSLIPKDQFYDMTTFVNCLIDKSYDISAFLIREYWLDIGTKESYLEALRRVEYED
jgi:dTDP-glucose pyrophosphorylase/predicted transcriptional regulator